MKERKFKRVRGTAAVSLPTWQQEEDRKVKLVIRLQELGGESGEELTFRLTLKGIEVGTRVVLRLRLLNPDELDRIASSPRFGGDEMNKSVNNYLRRKEDFDYVIWD